MKARVSHLHKTETEWLKLSDWKPEAGELVIYDPDEYYNYARLKVGDGKRTLKDLPFFIENTISELLEKQQYFEIVDSGRITNFQ